MSLCRRSCTVEYDGINSAAGNRWEADLCCAGGSDGHERCWRRKLLADEEQKSHGNEDNSDPFNAYFTLEDI